MHDPTKGEILMANKKPKILLLCNQRVREGYILPDELERMEAFANWAHSTQSGSALCHHTSLFPISSLVSIS